MVTSHAAGPESDPPRRGRSAGAEEAEVGGPEFAFEARMRAELTDTIYRELRQLARQALASERVDHTLQPTALAHEAWLRLADQEQEFQDGAHFKAIAARMIRRILVDHARQHGSAKRGGRAWRVSLCEGLQVANETIGLELLGLDAALHKLRRVGERPHSVVELRFFGGLGLGEVAHILGIAESTASADWRFARAWLRRELEPLA